MELTLKNVSKTYENRPVIMDLSFSVGGEEKVKITGRSGAGKTTLLRLILGLEKPDSGKIEVSAKKIGVLFQEDCLVQTLSIEQNIFLVMDPKTKEERKALAGKIREDAAKLSLSEELLVKPAADLSGGERRRGALLRAFLYGRELLILDEPFAGLDQKTKEQVKSYIIKTIGKRTLLVTDHDGEDFPETEFREISLSR